MPHLALRGGEPVLKKQLPPVITIGQEEKDAAMRVLDRGVLSDFVGARIDKFLGGVEVKRLEEAMCAFFGVRHAVSTNSATTALHAALVALEIGPGDEVIVTPYTMSATVAAILMNGAIPVFADIDERTFCIDPWSIRQCISDRTKAIMVVNLFGGVADFEAIRETARASNLKIIEDNAQAPLARYKGKLAGNLGDVGVFSFNVHKIMQCGEGGVLVTDNQEYAFRAQLVRNHGEVYVDQSPELANTVMLGSNYRMSEIHAAIAYEQLQKLEFFTKKKLELIHHLSRGLKDIPGLVLPYVPPDVEHVFYVYPMRILESFGIKRDVFVDAMAAEGFPMSKGYTKPFYLMPILQNRRVFNTTHFPFEGSHYNKKITYLKGLCPVAERMYESEFTFTMICQYPRTIADVDLFVTAVHKILEYKNEL